LCPPAAGSFGAQLQAASHPIARGLRFWWGALGYLREDATRYSSRYIEEMVDRVFALQVTEKFGSPG